MGEENIIDSIPLAEADLVTVSEKDSSQSVQYAKRHDLVSSIKSGHSLGRIENIQSEPEAGEATNTHPQIFKRIHSTKIFNHAAKETQCKSEEDPAKKKGSVLQISTIADGFNSGRFQFSFLL